MRKMITRWIGAAALIAAAAGAYAGPVTGRGTWETTLKARDINGNAVALNSTSAAFFYDTTLNITWLANMNVNGQMTWDTARTWTANLTSGGFTDWRLPSVVDSGAPGCERSYSGPDCGYNVLTQVGSAYSEWAHLYYVTLGNLALCQASAGSDCIVQPGSGLQNTAYFQNFQNTEYWYGQLYFNSQGPWVFSHFDGSQDALGRDSLIYAAAVRTGDVLGGPATVPEPGTMALALTALAGLGLARRLRRAS